jgi:hypothetical protein
MRWVALVVWAWCMLGGCQMGPSEERLGCLQGCGRDKDSCMLAAMTPPHIQYCDARSAACNDSCPQ